MISNLINNILKDESGQGITEYGAVIAFVAVIAAAIFSTGQSSLMAAIQNSFSGVANDINQLTAAAS